MNIFTTILIQPLANGLILFYRLLGNNMGLAIIGFSLLLVILLNPLTKPYMNSMKKMKDLAPQLEKLKSKYKNDKMKLAQAQADFYKQKGVNPSAGCLPYLLQIVVLIAFFNVFTLTLTNHEKPAEKFNHVLYAPLKFKESETLNTKFLYLDVSKPDVIKLPFITFALPGPLLILAALAQLISVKLTSPQVNLQQKIAEKTKESTDDFQVAMQKSMTYTFPLITIFIGLRFASGLALYWLIFSGAQAYKQLVSSDVKIGTLFKDLKIFR
ncbi:hypothetical protein A2955_03725 [Candidatus Woesebacteria bacterium RIFCSPLOWO2_01_FULL_37_19]|uniref:Membrane insertase YidC/Oxa/ALB C-terminal domain-containing protein n=2 Tax=Candidatus Woeseibacteriota TaxID=1752722 RepID=A0A1F8AXZ6_9BACT|nr:MAG: hypothetical protein A2771_04125 [Candidatus Woesebacteria bacterium RIFCSPHIGHO2_01_FULL_38_26b]OGM56611.1 MAG: hypothetical protein A2955_03725 [Candidatus Woesebacteria bacterium RIFCSPLOWO2_01_FULL_37_19]